MVNSSQERNEKSMAVIGSRNLPLQKKRELLLRKESIHKMAEANKAFSNLILIFNYVKRFMFTRNIGIAAHIDAGKTTTTERICSTQELAIRLVRFMMGLQLWIDGARAGKRITILAATTCNWSFPTNQGKSWWY